MKIDFKKFKKLESDEKSTTLQHEGGHMLKIAHKGLSEEHRKELDELPVQNLAKGGRAKFAQRYDPNIKGSRASKPSKSSTTMPGSPTESKKTYTEPGDQGTRTGAYIPGAPSPHEPDDISAGARNAYYGTHGKYPPCINSSCKSYGHPHPNCKCYGPTSEAGSFMAEGGEVEYYCDANREHRKGCEYYAGGGGPGLASKEVNDDPAAQDVQQWAPDTMGTDPMPQPTPDSVQRPQYNMTDPTNIAQPINPNAELSGTQQAPPPPDEGSDVGKELKDAEDAAGQAPQTEPPKTPIDTFQGHKDATIQELVPEAQAFKADLDNGHITPETYSSLFAKKDTLGKIGTLFGLMLSGAGSGLSHQPNMLMEMMNKEIDRDLHAQQESVVNKQNFLKINQQNTLNQAQSKNLTAEANTKAYALARTQMNYAALHKLVTDTDKLPDGPQKQQAMQTLAMMNQGVQNENFNILDRAASASALSKTLFPDQQTGGGQPNTTLMKSGLVGPEAKEMGSDIESKTIPGIPGRAQRPIPEQTRSEVTAMDTLSKKASDLLQFAKANKGSLSPATRALGSQKAAEMVNFYNSSLQGGILTQGRLHWLDQQIGKNPTSIFQDLLGNNARLNEIKNSNDMRKNIILKNVGLSAPESSGAPAEQTSKSGRPMTQKNGKWVYK